MNMDLLNVIHPDNLEENQGMRQVVFARLVNGEFSPSSEAVLLDGTEVELKRQGKAPDPGFVEVAAIDDLLEWSESFDDDPNELIAYVNSLAFPQD